MTSTEQFTFFFGHDESKVGNSAIFSNWYPASFDDPNGTCSYVHTEQYMMAKKADLFGDKEMLSKIMKTSSPKSCKTFGRRVKNFDQEVWAKKCYEIVKDGVYLKFSQNPDLLQVLMDTSGTTLVEASPYDKIWGIGLKSTSPLAQNRSTWKGSNLLGEILTEVRNELEEEM